MGRHTLGQRWAMLAPKVRAFGPEDALARPAVLIFHGCGGMRGQLDNYGRAAADAGFRAFVVDSYAPRGWSRYFGMTFVCSGLLFRGWERAGDVAAAIHGVSALPGVDPTRIALAGFSHGGWGVMELMCAPLERAGELGVADAHTCPLNGVRSVFLGYPYIGPGAVRRTASWRRKPAAFLLIARRDHLTTQRNAAAVVAAVEESGVSVETWLADGTHAFDEPIDSPPMQHDPVLTVEAIARFRGFLEATLV